MSSVYDGEEGKGAVTGCGGGGGGGDRGGTGISIIELSLFAVNNPPGSHRRQ